MKLSLLSIITWGFLTGNWMAAGLLVLLMSASLLTSHRLTLSLKQFYNAGNMTSAFFVLAVVLLSIIPTQQRAVFVLLEWLPVFFFPLLLLQLYSTNNNLPTGILLYSMRKRQPIPYIDFHLPYSFICLLATGVIKENNYFYFVACFLIIGCALWSVRSKNSALIFWFSLVGCAYGFSFMAQQCLIQLQKDVETLSVEWLSNWETDPFKSRTSIGELGQMKLSNRIEFRVKADEPLLLLQATYDRYIGQSWISSQRTFSYTPHFSGDKDNKEVKQLEVFQPRKRSTMLALPSGTIAIKGLEGAQLQFTSFGAIKLTEAPDFVNYQLLYTGKSSGQASAFDLQIPNYHRGWIKTLQQQLNIDGQPPAIIAKKITQFFQQNYYYSLFLGNETETNKALEDFILNRKAGHCEYFAVASTLLLRSYGIPARLANGYAMQEYSPSEQRYIVRRRHSHAWSIAQIKGSWQAVDATPARWLQIENDNAAFWQPIYDVFSSLYFQYKQWRYQQLLSDNQDNKWLIGLALGLSFILLIRLYQSRQTLLLRTKKQTDTPTLNYKGKDSELYLIETALENSSYARLDHESFKTWAKRLNNTALIEIVDLHYHYRFDNDTFTAEKRLQLRMAVNTQLKESALLRPLIKDVKY